MSAISYAALPEAEKRAAAIDLARDHNPTQIAELLGVGWNRVKSWIDPAYAAAHRERERTRMRVKRAGQTRTKTKPCGCGDPLIDPLTDRYFKRAVHCVYCGKAVER